MILTFAEDFSTTTNLDSELIGASDSGLYWNRGTHPVVTAANLLELLPITEFTFSDYAVGTTYEKFEDSRSRSDIVLSGGKVYQSLVASNIGNDPVSSPTQWLETNIESLRIKSFIWSVEDSVSSALSINRKLIENQYIYNVGDQTVTLPNDFSGWVFEPKGSDYVNIRINQIALQALTSSPVNLYVINQNTLVDTIVLNPQDGKLVFEDSNYVISGKGRFIFAFDSQDVLSNNAFNSPLKNKGFVGYPVSGIGATAEDAEYTEVSNGNGLNFNISAYLDSDEFISNNKIDLAKFYQAQFEMDFLNMLLSSANSRSNRTQRILTDGLLDRNMLFLEVSDLNNNTAARRYDEQRKTAISSINATFDTALKSDRGKLKVNIGTI
jgi:hypothetical protein